MLATLAAVRAAEWVFTLLGVIGMLVSIYTALDATADLRARIRAGLNGDLETVGRIARRGALASMLLHAGFVFIGFGALLGLPPVPRQYARTVMVATVYVLIQLAVVFAQIRNQYDRHVVRSHTTGDPNG